MSLVAGGAGFLGSHLIDALIAAGDDVIIADNLSTGSLANPLVHPQPESYNGNVDLVGPRAGRAETQRFAEAAIVAAAGRGLDARIARFFTCYGPRMSRPDGRLIAALADAADAQTALPIHGDGRQTRSMTFVDDPIEQLLIAAGAPPFGLAPISIGSDEALTVLQIAETFARAAGTPFVVEHSECRPGDPRRRRSDLTKLSVRSDRPQTTLEIGLAKTIAWMRDSTGANV